MKINKDSLEILDNSEIPSFFRVGIKRDTIFIQEKTDNQIYGNILVYAEDVGTAFDLAMEHKDTIDYLFFIDSTRKDVQTIAQPEKIQLNIDDIFKKIGSITEDFEKREEQIKLSKRIEECLENGKYGIFEAPTGTGKSIAYLIPAILHAKRNRQKIVISTNTINLQRQLMEKDLPVLESILKFKARSALGRANYLCRRKLDALFERGNVFLFEENSTYEKLKNFAKTSRTGVKSEFFNTKDTADDTAWESVASSSLTCAHTKCPYYKNRCFYYRAKASLENADLIVANHHIVLSDAVMKEARVLPEFETVIFDEAHNLEKNATNYFTQTVSTSEITRMLDRLYAKKKKNETGFITETASENEKNTVIITIKKIKETVAKTISFFQSIRQDDITLNAKNISEIKPVVEMLSSSLFEIYHALKKWKDNVDISGISQSLKESAEALDVFLEIDDEYVKWIKKTRNYVHFNMTPISVSGSLKENIYDNVQSAVFTSATICVNKNFDFFKKTVGIEEAEEFIAENNFNYDKISRLILIKDTPPPDSVHYVYALKKIITKATEALRSYNLGVLTLFTSYRMLNTLYQDTRETLENLGFNTLKQGDLDNFETLREFKKQKSFLFATSSFWEGIDVKGRALSVVLITRLPFEVPSTPVENSRYELMKKEGVNAFLEYSLPKAVLRFRQGFGRLIRDKKDRGIIIVSDSRIVQKSYGKFFTDSLPKIEKEVIKTDEIKDSVGSFFSNI